MKYLVLLLMLAIATLQGFGKTEKEKCENPIIHADVPDMSMIRVGDTYYMSSTTMHMNPGVPIMKSTDLVNWEIVSYAYDVLADNDAMNLENGKHAYGRGSWASSLRYHEGTYYVSTFSSTTGKTYIFSTNDIENGTWKRQIFDPSYHDNTIFFDDDGNVYMIWGNGKLSIAQLKDDLSGIKEGTAKVLIENASAPAGDNIMLGAEGAQLFKVNGKYYLFVITWPRGGMRTVVVHRADDIHGPWEGRVALQDKGVAQGGMIDTPDGRWFSYLFRDNGAVGRIPYLVPLNWEDKWPVLGVDGKVPKTLDLPASEGLIPGIVASDDFKRKRKEADLPLVWQWNHKPVDSLWSVRARKGYLRLRTGKVVNELEEARNTLTQRTIGPACTGKTSIDVSNLKDGDIAGLTVFQSKYGQLGVKCENGKKFVVMISAKTGEPVELERVPLLQDEVQFKIECDYRDREDVAYFYYSIDGENWKEIGEPLHMEYTLDHFMGYRFGLYNYATKSPGGFADFDYFKIDNQVSK
jgi:beta-xylosidase